ncbi:hypothetical protein H1R20_g8462, partial [Candolleomyces eurysporus]
MPGEVKVSGKEVAKHNSRESCWIIVHDKVYDVTDFLDGMCSPVFYARNAEENLRASCKIILKYAGKDATQEYDPIHPPDAITTHLPREKHLGTVEPDTAEKIEVKITDLEKLRLERFSRRPPLSEVLNLHDFEAIAKLVMPEKAWAYYSSAADDEITNRENHAAYHRVWFRPRILVDVTKTATALGKLGHPDGELNLTRAAAKHGVIQMIPTLASCSFDELVDAAQPNQVQFLQLYVNKDREVTKRIVQHAEKRGIKGLFITVDAPQLGRREKSFIDPGLNWNDLDWFKSITNMPLILKGVQRWEDALKAYDLGLAGVVLSNHGGRQLDFARSGLEVLVEVVRKLGKRRGLKFPNEKFQLFVDGGVRRATDVIKAVALGATAVGIGRPFLYAFSGYGQEGVEHALQILKDEFEMNLRLIGATSIKDITRDMVDCSNLSSHVVAVPGDRLYNTNYESMQTARLKEIKAKL